VFGAIWLFPLITALGGGDIFASEDHNGTPQDDPHALARALADLRRKALAATTYAVVAIFLSGTVA